MIWYISPDPLDPDELRRRIAFVPNVRTPSAPTAGEIAAGVVLDDLAMSPWLEEEPLDVGDPPSGWCDRNCHCGQPCGEFIDHNGSCACLSH